MKRQRLLVPLVLLALIFGGCFANPFAGTGSISVTSDPPNAKVYLNGEDTGQTTPAVLENIPVGSHTIRVELPGVGEDTRTVVVQKGKEAVIHIDLGEPSVTGFVSHRRGGSPVEGVTVVAYEAGTNIEVASATTDANGIYRLYLPDGEYELLASKPNHAQGRVQRVVVDGNHPVSADIMLPTILDPTKSAVAPVISVTGVEPGEVIDGGVTVTVNVESEYPVASLRAMVGHKDPSRAIPVDSNSMVFFIDPSDYPTGETTLIVDTYDIQFNWAEIRIPIEIFHDNDAPELFVPRVVDVKLHAITYGKELQLFRLQRAELYQNGLLTAHPDQLRLHDGTLIDLTNGKADATMQITIHWSPTRNAVAYEIQRAWSADGPWETVAKLPVAVIAPADGFEFSDYSAALQPNVETFYRIRGIGPNGELGEYSTPISVIPLERFEVRLVSPADDSVGVPLNPTFEWEHNGVGAHQVFFGYVSSVTAPASEYYVWQFMDEDITSAPYNYDGFALSDLKPGTYYRWDIFHAYAYTMYGQRSIAQSFAREGRYLEERGAYINSGSINGDFGFVTAYEAN